MSSFTIKIDGLDEATKVLKQYPEKSKSAFQQAISKTVRAVKAESQRRAPSDTGRLRSSIHIEKETATEGIVDSGVSYAIYIHEGTRPHFPPPASLAGWARRHGTNPYLVARGISRRGTKARPFMRDAATQLQGAIERWFGEAMVNIFK